MSYCSSCGKPLTPGVAFCTACGATQAAAPSIPPEGAMPPAAFPGAKRVEASSVVGESFRLVFRNFGAFLGTQGIFILIGAAISLAVAIVYIRPATADMFAAFEAFSASPEDFDPLVFFSALAPLLRWAALSGLAVAILSLVGAGFGLVAADLLRAGQPATMSAVWAQLGPRFGNYLTTAILVRLGLLGVVLAGAILFFLIVPVIAGIVVAIMLYLRWAMAAPASIYETGRPRENLKRSGALTEGVRGDLFVIGLVAIGVTLIPGVVVGSALGFASAPTIAADGTTFEQPPVWVDVVRWAFATAAQLVSSFFLSAAFMAFYRRLAA